MRLERALQAGHSEYMRVVAAFENDEIAKRVHEELICRMEEIFSRADKFECAAFFRGFKSEADFQEWKTEEWDPVADEGTTLAVEREPDGRIHVRGNYGLILDDWLRSEVSIALDCETVVIRTYTAGYGLDYLEHWLAERGGIVDVETEQYEYGFVPFKDALEEVQAAAHPHGADRIRAPDSGDDPAQPPGD